MASKASHYLVITYPSWAHIRTQIALTNSLLQLNPDLHVTMLLPAKRSKAAALEIAQYPAIPEERLKTVHYGVDEQKEVGGMWNPRGGFRDECMAQLEPILDALAAREPITDPITGEVVTLYKRPYDVILSDITLTLSGGSIKSKVNELTGITPRLISSCPYNSAFLLFFMMQKGEFIARVNRMVDESAGDEAKLEQLKQELITNNSDLAPPIPDLWPFHFYEACPVAEETILRYAPRVAGMIKFFNSLVDGYIVAWPQALGTNQQPLLEMNFGKVFQVGPQLPAVGQGEWSVEAKKGECKEYLDASPERSVIYVSFGSVLYAPSYDQIRILLDVFQEIGTRYIIAEGNAPPETKDLLRSRIGKGKDKGLLVTWAPQRAILSHKATRVFLSHGGSNSAMESMLFKVPMVQWPSGFDQPYIANELDKLGVARELLQIRDGFNIGKPVARNGTVVEGTEEALRKELLEVFGPDSTALLDALRSKVEEVGDLLRVDRDTGGSAAAVRELAFLGSKSGE